MGSIAYYAAPINDAERIAALLLAAHAGGARVFSSPARLAAPRALLGVEAEIAFRLGTDLQPEEALALIDLCSTRLADWPNAPARWKPADFQSNDACIAGRGTRAWRLIDFGSQRVELAINGAVTASAVGSHPSGDPSRLVPAAAKRARLASAKRGSL